MNKKRFRADFVRWPVCLSPSSGDIYLLRVFLHAARDKYGLPVMSFGWVMVCVGQNGCCCENEILGMGKVKIVRMGC